jgi:hypothetical protein
MADNFPGSLRDCLRLAEANTRIVFDVAVFDPRSPATIYVNSDLPALPGGATIDGSDAGVIIDGSLVGTVPETVLFDDVALQRDGVNLISNGDFSDGLAHWRGWEHLASTVRTTNGTDYHSPEASFDWQVTKDAGVSRTAYTPDSLSDPLEQWPYAPDSPAWMDVVHGETLQLSYWHRYGAAHVGMQVKFANGSVDYVYSRWIAWHNDWTQEVADVTIPKDAVAVALVFGFDHPQAWPMFDTGLYLGSNSDFSVVQGLQILNFSGDGITVFGSNKLIGGFGEGEGNTIGGCGTGIVLANRGESNNIIGNYIGTDESGSVAMGNLGNGIAVGWALGTRFEGNAIAHNGAHGIELTGSWAWSIPVRNTFTQNSIFSNAGKGISFAVAGANEGRQPPDIVNADTAAGLVDGTATACPYCVIEVFSDDEDEGRIYEGSVTADGTGNWVFNKGASLAGPYVTTTATDAAGNTSEFSRFNQLPHAVANGPYTIAEGGSLSLDATGSFDPECEPLSYRWDVDGDGDYDEGITGITPLLQWQDLMDLGINDGPDTRDVTLLVDDGQGGLGEAYTTLTINNVAPSVGLISAPVDPVQVGTPINVSVDFTDPGILDTHTTEWVWGDTTQSAGTVSEVGGSGTANDSHTYTEAGVYTILAIVTDKDGDVGESIHQFVVIYDPDGGFVTGGGWFMSPVGAYTADPALTGKANFGFVSKYQKGAEVPTGNTEFQFKAGDLNFHSDSYDWLVIAGHKAKYKGVGTINGSGNYGFMISAIDEELTPSTDVDLFRIKIWDKDNEDTIVYDNLMGGADDADPTTAIGGGNIVIHKAKK